MRRLRAAALAVAVSSTLAACNGGSASNPPPPIPNPSAYPTAVDGFEGAGKDDTAATASHAAVGEVQHRTLFPAGDVDWVKVPLQAGPTYELSVNRLSTATDLYAYLYAPDGTTVLGEADDFIDLDPALVFTVAADGDYYVKVTSFSSQNGSGVRNGQGSYTLSVHLFVDADGDGYSTYYDCDDANSTIHPFATDIPGDGIDQDCDGMDALDATSVADRFEPDNDPTHAKTLATPTGDPFEYEVMRSLFAANAHTLTPGDEDWITFTAAPREKIEYDAATFGPGVGLATVFRAPDLTTPVAGPSGIGTGAVENTTDTTQRYYIRYTLASGTLFYVPFHFSLGFDLDHDGFYSRDWDDLRDCNDGDANIHPGATETPGDHVDSNCNGDDDT